MSIYSQIIEWEVLSLEQQKEYEEIFTEESESGDYYGIIYRVTNSFNGKVYIGQTIKGLENRKARHLRDYTKEKFSHFALYRALTKHGEDSFTWEVIDAAKDAEQLNEKEVEWIKIHQSNKGKGYNMTAGGQGVKNYRVTENGIQRRKDVFNRMWANGHTATLQRGEDAHNAKFKNIQVREIVQLLINRELTVHEIAAKYSVTAGNVSGIKSGKTYRHLVTDEEIIKMNERREGEYKRTKEITKEEVLQMKDLLLKTSIPSTEIYNLYDINHGHFNNILYHSEFSSLFTEEEVRFSRNRRQARLFTEEEVVEIKELLQEELYTFKELAMIFNSKESPIRDIYNGDRWSNILIDLPMEDIEDYEWKFIDWKPQKPNRKN